MDTPIRDTDKALEYYGKIAARTPRLLATYYHAAKLYADVGKRKKPRSVPGWLRLRQPLHARFEGETPPA